MYDKCSSISSFTFIQNILQSQISADFHVLFIANTTVYIAYDERSYRRTDKLSDY